MPGLAETFEVLCPDRRGHARTTDVAGPISHELVVRDTVASLQQLIGGPAALVGHSDGVPVALLTALLTALGRISERERRPATHPPADLAPAA